MTIDTYTDHMEQLQEIVEDWNDGVFTPANDTTDTAFWSDIDGATPRVWRMRDRVFIGDATATNDKRITGGVQPDWGSYANWAPRDSDFCVMSSRGSLAITGLSRTSDNAGASPTISTWGLGGLVIVDNASSFGRAIYGDVQAENGIVGAVGLELAIKNKAAAETTAYSPYSATVGTKGIVITAGGDPAYGGTPVSHVAAGLVFQTGDNAGGTGYKLVKGIVFDQYVLKGADGTGGSLQRAGVALEMAVGHNIVWTGTGGVRSAAIMATGVGSAPVSLIFQDDTAVFTGASGGTIFRGFHTANAVNFLSLQNNITANHPLMIAAGSDTDINLRLSGKGTGLVDVLSKLRTKASTTASASLNLPNGTAPTSPVDGDVWVESNTLKIRLNGATVTVTTA